MMKRKAASVYIITSLPSARSQSLGKDFFNLKIHFAECPGSSTRQRRLCRVPTDKHSAKNGFRVLKITLPSAPRMTLGKTFFAECHSRTLDKVYFLFSLPNFLWYVPTLCRPTCTILAQLSLQETHAFSAARSRRK
jgi:hypothetical protein